MRAIINALNRAGPAGLSIPEISLACGMGEAATREIVAALPGVEMLEDGRAVVVESVIGCED